MANDLAVLKLDGGTYPALPVAPSRRIRLGQAVATIGFPNVEIQGFSPKVTRGEISSLNGIGDDPRAWQISVPVQPGNSGGALLEPYLDSNVPEPNQSEAKPRFEDMVAKAQQSVVLILVY